MISHRFSAFLAHAFAWTLITIGLVISSNSIYIVFLAPIILIDLWFALCLGFMLRLPTIRKDVEAPPGWEWESMDVQGYPVRWLKSDWNPNKPLAILIHGWNSRASNMMGRSALFHELGYNCVLFEMRAHGGNKRVPHWAAMHVCHDLEKVLIQFEHRGWLKNGFLVHGHSLGGFVAQRVLRPELNTSKNALAVILESPVTSYEYINNQTCDYLKIPKKLQRPMMRRLLRYYNQLNPPQYQVPSIEFLKTPEWGLPQCPTILIQAKHDATLGLKHAQLLIDVHTNSQSEFTYHIVEELKHSYEQENDVRNELIRTWLEEHSLFFS